MAVATPYSILYSSNEIFAYQRNVIGAGISLVFPGSYVGRPNQVAVKRIQLTPSLTEDEFQNHKTLNHENVVELLAVFDDFDFRFMVLELCSGSLYQVIKKTYNGPALPSDRDVMYQIAAGLAYVHAQNLVHLDIKPENILISTMGQMKLADFGLSMKTLNGVCNLPGSHRGTYSWMAPEVCPEGNNIADVEVISAMADVFSFGCVCFVFLTREHGGIHPFGDWNLPHEVQLNIRNDLQVNTAALRDLPFANAVLPMIEHRPENRGSLEVLMINL